MVLSVGMPVPVIVPNLVKKGGGARNGRVEQKEDNGAKQSDPQA